MVPRARRQLVKVSLTVTFLGLLGYGCVGVSPAAPSAVAVSSPGTSQGVGPSVPQQSGPEVTLGPSKTRKPKHTLPPTATGVPATATETTSATDVPTDAPTDAPVPTGGPTPAGSGGGLHLGSFRLSSFIILPINPRLDYTAAANYGEANLSAGFTPDPYSVGMTTGGLVDVSYLGSSCAGFATTAPDLRVNFGGGGATLLRIYFVGSTGDPAIVINDPYGNFYCVDDSFGTVNPTIDFNNPAGGSYDVWVANYAANTQVSGTLYLTESSGSHP